MSDFDHQASSYGDTSIDQVADWLITRALAGADIETLYRNIGVPEQVEFSVISAAANEATRIESLTKTVGHHALASKAFVNLCSDDWTSVGLHPLRGVGQ